MKSCRSLGPFQEVGGFEGLRRLRLGPVHHPNHDDAGGANVQRQFDLLILGLSRSCRINFACDLRSAGLSRRTRFVCIHLLVDVALVLRVRQHSCHLSVTCRPHAQGYIFHKVPNAFARFYFD